MTTSRDQSNIAPIVRNWVRMRSMFAFVHSAGSRPRSIAAFSAGSPKLSKPIGNITLNPSMRCIRATMSGPVAAYQWPMCRSPDGYGYIVRM